MNWNTIVVIDLAWKVPSIFIVCRLENFDHENVKLFWLSLLIFLLLCTESPESWISELIVGWHWIHLTISACSEWLHSVLLWDSPNVGIHGCNPCITTLTKYLRASIGSHLRICMICITVNILILLLIFLSFFLIEINQVFGVGEMIELKRWMDASVKFLVHPMLNL